MTRPIPIGVDEAQRKEKEFTIDGYVVRVPEITLVFPDNDTLVNGTDVNIQWTIDEAVDIGEFWVFLYSTEGDNWVYTPGKVEAQPGETDYSVEWHVNGEVHSDYTFVVYYAAWDASLYSTKLSAEPLPPCKFYTKFVTGWKKMLDL